MFVVVALMLINGQQRIPTNMRTVVNGLEEKVEKSLTIRTWTQFDWFWRRRLLGLFGGGRSSAHCHGQIEWAPRFAP